jgi:hypothetical protein
MKIKNYFKFLFVLMMVVSLNNFSKANSQKKAAAPTKGPLRFY